MSAFSFKTRSAAPRFLPGRLRWENAQTALRWLGLLVALSLIAKVYRADGHQPVVRHLLYGLRPAVLAWVVCQARGFLRESLSKVKLVMGACLGLVFFLWFRLGSTAAPAGAAAPLSSAALGLSVLKAGVLSLGSAPAFLALLWWEWGMRSQWLTGAAVLDALALGALSEAPLGVAVAFLLFFLAGVAGGLAVGALALLPAFAWRALVPAQRPWWLSAAALALSTWAWLQLAPFGLVDLPSSLLFFLCLLAFRKLGFLPVALGSSLAGYLWMVLP